MTTLDKIQWQFNRNQYTNINSFNKDITEYQESLDKNNWRPDEIVCERPKIQIQYMAWVRPKDLLPNEHPIEEDLDTLGNEDYAENGYYQIELLAILKADNGRNFTALELLFKIHNQQANKELGDHIFFEGLGEVEIIEDQPTYYIGCGS